MAVYLIRHAERLPGKDTSDSQTISLGLSKYGRAQANAIGRKAKDLKVTKIFSSPIQRAMETAEIISKKSGVEVIVDERLREFFTDPFASDPNLRKKQKKEAKESPDKVFPAGESLNMAIERLKNFIISVDHPGEGIVAVTHRVVTEGFLAREFGVGIDKVDWLDNASLTKLELDTEGELYLEFVNRRYRDFPLLFSTFKRRLQFDLLRIRR